MNYKQLYKKITKNKLVLYFSPFVIYLIVAYLLWGPSHFSDIHRLFFTPSGDTELFTWSLNWWPYSVAHGINPFLEKFLFNPSGYNLAWSTSVSSLALLMAPVTAIWGAMTSFNVLALVAIPLSALSCFYLVYYICKKYWAAVLCGFIYGFSTFQVAQLLGHPCFYASFVPPLIVLAILLRFNNRLRKIPFILILGVLLTIQFGISSEAFASMILLGGIAWLLILIFGEKKIRPKLFKATLELIYGAIVAVILLSPFIYYIISGYSKEPSYFYPAVGYSTDLLNFIVPTKITLIGGKTFLNVSSKFTANAAEQGAYLSIPLVVFMISFCIYYWKKWYVKVLAFMTLAVAVLTLGPRLQTEGIRGWFPLPEALLTRLPLFRSMLPMRLSEYLFLIAAIMLGCWFLFKPRRSSKNKNKALSLFKYAFAIAVIILLLPRTSNYSWQNVSLPNLFSKNVASKYIGVHKNVLFLPYNVGYDPDLWQVYSGMEFTTANGYLGWPPVTATNTKTAYDLYNEIPQNNFKVNFIAFCQSRHISEIIYAPYALQIGPVEIREIQSLKWPSYTVDKFVIIKVPKAYQ